MARPGVGSGEMVEGGLDGLIEKRAQEMDGEASEERARLWRESAEQYEQRERENNRLAWIEHYQRMAASHSRLADDYDERAWRLAREGIA
jgi:hypothetical protein